MLKRIFDLLVGLVSQPAKAWSDLSNKRGNNNEQFFKSYLYPLLGIVALLSFVGVFITMTEGEGIRTRLSIGDNFQFALKNCIRLVIITFAGYHAASYILSEVMKKIFKRPGELVL